MRATRWRGRWKPHIAFVSALETAHRELRLELKSEHRRTLDDFVALAGAGAGALVERAAEPQLRSQAEHVVAAYEALASAAAAMPRMREMREYLRATALMPDITGDIAGNDAAVDQAVAAAQIECQLLLAAIDGASATMGPAQFRRARSAVSEIQMELHPDATRPRMSAGGARASASRSNSPTRASISARLAGSIRSPRWALPSVARWGRESKSWSAGLGDAPLTPGSRSI